MPFLATWGSMPFMAGQFGYVSQEEQADEEEAPLNQSFGTA